MSRALSGVGATFSGALGANGVMSLGNDGTYGSTYKTLGLTGNTDGTHRIFGGTSDDLYIASATSRNIQFWTNGVTSTRMIITSGGNVGIGTSSPISLLEVRGATPFIRITDTAVSAESGLVMDATGGLIRGGLTINYGTGEFKSFCGVAGNSYFQTFHTNGSERMRITSVGDVLVGATSVPSGAVSMGAGSVFINNNLYIGNTAGTGGYAVRFDGYANALYAIWQNASGTDQGGVYLSYGATSWTANSDLRLKDINGTIDNALDKIMTLRPVNFSWKSDETKKEMLGLIAQDVEKVFPQLIDENRDGYMGVRYQELVPVLIAAIQEQQAQIEALQADVETLKNK